MLARLYVMEEFLHVYLYFTIFGKTLGTDISTHFLLTSASDTVRASFVTASSSAAHGVSQCGIHCSKTSLPSFIYEGSLSMCYCGNHTLSFVPIEERTDSSVFGYITAYGNDSTCQSLYNIGFREDGVYNVGPVQMPTFCSPIALGWTVFQRRIDGSVDFYNRTWADYVDGFGSYDGEFWLGLEHLHQMTQNGCELHVYLEAFPDNTLQVTGYAKYSDFTIGGPDMNYTLHVQGFSGNVGDSLTYHNGMKFSTQDVDNDPSFWKNCARRSDGAWWYKGCHLSNLNGLYLGGHTAHYAVGVTWFHPWGHYYSIRRTEMAYRC